MSDIKDEILKKIKNEEIKMRSKNFFILMKAVFEILLFALLIFAVFFFNLSFYLPRRNMAGRGMVLQNIPWVYVAAGIAGLGIFLWLIYRYTGAYKKHFLAVVGVISVSVLIVAYLVSISTINERLEGRRQMRGLYGQPRHEQQFRGPGFNNR